MVYEYRDSAKPIGSRVKFTLQYDGVLVSNQQGSQRLTNKRDIRFALNPLLRKLWEHESRLKWLGVHQGNLARLRSSRFVGNRLRVEPLDGPLDGPMAWSPFPYVIIDRFTYVMLVNSLNAWLCDLDIKVLMPADVGKRGDLDNRIKTLFDGLIPPHDLNQAKTDELTQPEFVFCLLEDDALIGNRRVEGGLLLSDVPSCIPVGERHNYVSARIEVTLRDSNGGPVRVAGTP